MRFRNALISGDAQKTSKRRHAVGLMISSSIAISFTGLIVRHLDADAMVMNFYRALSMMIAIVLIVALKYRRLAFLTVIRISWPGVLAAMMLTLAAITFLQSMTHTTVANTLFILGAIPFFTAGVAWRLLGRVKIGRAHVRTPSNG